MSLLLLACRPVSHAPERVASAQAEKEKRDKEDEAAGRSTVARKRRKKGVKEKVRVCAAAAYTGPCVASA
jgi:hypothetical protein